MAARSRAAARRRYRSLGDAARAHGGASDREPFEHHGHQIEFDFAPLQEGDQHQPTVAAQEAHVSLQVGSADYVEHEVDAFLSGGLRGGRGQILLAVVDRLVGRSGEIDGRCEDGSPRSASPAFTAAIEEPAVIERMLTHLGLCAQPPPRTPARRVDLLQAA
jgi:hypothetical protein